MTQYSPRLILASASPRRYELLASLNIPLVVEPAHTDEAILDGERAEHYVLRLARAKAEAVRNTFFADYILAADTTVVLPRDDAEQIFGKPESEQEAVRMLQTLSGNEHKVLTAFCLIAPERQERTERVVTTNVRFAKILDKDISWYVRTGEPLDKAGAYAIQGRGGCFIESITGSYSNVVGLPLAQVVESLRAIGFPVFQSVETL